ncbi:hypothetical protein ACLI09_09505 [Flavobacterium sp. RHBU_24]|uniref:hypothetical protein n=1 Tax=Flavobacterium sp. RHBU_24 TaxID=3391185 RepID=UPI00398543B7
MNDIAGLLITELNEISIKLNNHTYSRADEQFDILNISAPPINRKIVLGLISSLVKKLEKFDIAEGDDDTFNSLVLLHERLIHYKVNSLSGFFNAQQVVGRVNGLLNLLQCIDLIISPFYNDWEHVDKNSLPKSLVKSITQTESELSELIKDKDKLASYIKTINDAGKLIETLEQELNQIGGAKERSENDSKNIERLNLQAATTKVEFDNIFIELDKRKTEADQIIKRANEAYGLATTVGLAASFDSRAKKLTQSMWLWVVLLFVALGSGIYIGHERFTAVNDALKDRTFVTGNIWILIFLSVLSLGAPIWFAWIATKQIGQRFKLSEDYAFKSSVAKAYEGYRTEAARIDPALEARLFASALTRLDELPIRFMDKETHGSPWQELLNNPALMKMLKEKPEALTEFFKEFSTSYFSKKKDD